jgi:hypothetical protein
VYLSHYQAVAALSPEVLGLGQAPTAPR